VIAGERLEQCSCLAVHVRVRILAEHVRSRTRDCRGEESRVPHIGFATERGPGRRENIVDVQIDDHCA
jgi:hypothetical protein